MDNFRSIFPKLAPVLLSKDNNYKPFFLNQKVRQIKIKYMLIVIVIILPYEKSVYVFDKSCIRFFSLEKT